jgi:hypothetical protein
MSAPIAIPKTPGQRLLAGSLLALLVIPAGVILFTLISSIGFVASFTGFAIAFGAVWLYGRGAGGIITRAGAGAITGIVIVTLLLGFYVSMVFDFANAFAKSATNVGHPLTAWTAFNSAAFWPLFNENFGPLFNDNALFFVLALAFGILGSFRILRRAFMTSVSGSSTAATFGTAPPTPPAQSQPPLYPSDVDRSPSASADEKTPPPNSQL